MRQVWKGLPALLLSLALLLGGCAPEPAREPDPEPQSVQTPAPTSEPTSEPTPEPVKTVLRLWLAEDQPLCGALGKLTEEYNAENRDVSLSLRVFSGSEELAEALAEEQPELLLCDERTALRLLEGERLGAANLRPELAPLFADAPGCAEGGYFPLGAEAPVLLTREEERAEIESLETMEQLFAAAADYGRRRWEPWCSADSFARLFACAMEQMGAPFYAMREQDLENEAYRDYYNLLADAAFEGGLAALDGPVLAAVTEGTLRCGFCSSRALAGELPEGLAVLPLPPLEGCDSLIDARLCGLAVGPEADAEETARFLSWLYADGRAAEAALAAGLAPATVPDADAADGLALVSLRCRLFLPDADGGYLNAGTEFERSFRAALALLR